MFSEMSEIVLPALYLLGSFFYCIFLQILARMEYRYKYKKNLFSEEMCLEKLAKIYGISEYTLFCAAASKWHISEQQMKAAFRTYLICGDIPYYVRDLVRHHKKEMTNHNKPLFPSSLSIP